MHRDRTCLENGEPSISLNTYTSPIRRQALLVPDILGYTTFEIVETCGVNPRLGASGLNQKPQK